MYEGMNYFTSCYLMKFATELVYTKLLAFVHVDHGLDFIPGDTDTNQH